MASFGAQIVRAHCSDQIFHVLFILTKTLRYFLGESKRYERARAKAEQVTAANATVKSEQSRSLIGCVADVLAQIFETANTRGEFGTNIFLSPSVFMSCCLQRMLSSLTHISIEAWVCCSQMPDELAKALSDRVSMQMRCKVTSRKHDKGSFVYEAQ